MLKRISVGILAINHLRYFLGIGRAIGDSGRAQLRLHRRGHHRSPADADELRGRRAQDSAPLCSGHVLLLDPDDRWVLLGPAWSARSPDEQRESLQTLRSCRSHWRMGKRSR